MLNFFGGISLIAVVVVIIRCHHRMRSNVSTSRRAFDRRDGRPLARPADLARRKGAFQANSPARLRWSARWSPCRRSPRAALPCFRRRPDDLAVVAHAAADRAQLRAGCSAGSSCCWRRRAGSADRSHSMPAGATSSSALSRCRCRSPPPAARPDRRADPGLECLRNPRPGLAVTLGTLSSNGFAYR